MRLLHLFTGLAAFVLIAGSAQAASFLTGFQNTVSSEGAPNGTGPGRFYHISVNTNNNGYASYAALDPSRSEIDPYTRTFSDPVVAWSFYGGGNSLNINEESGGLISYTTTDTAFNSFGQNQAKFWNATDPGSDFNLAEGLADPNTTTQDKNLTGYRAFNQVTGTIDISELKSGTANIFYGDFNSTPGMSAVMRDTDGPLPDIEIDDFHLNGDFANRAEFYAAELNFVTDGAYDTIIYDYDGGEAGRAGGVVLTGQLIPEPSTSALLGLGGLALIFRRRRK